MQKPKVTLRERVIPEGAPEDPNPLAGSWETVAEVRAASKMVVTDTLLKSPKLGEAIKDEARRVALTELNRELYGPVVARLRRLQQQMTGLHPTGGGDYERYRVFDRISGELSTLLAELEDIRSYVE